ncbi:ribonuclease P protein component [Parvularcula mediterranea]|uniref:ribonuclease P protein component n=1 Tax=Parvularcula mediterranea TaxID=2732508 RepID=UPI0038CD5BE6
MRARKGRRFSRPSFTLQVLSNDLPFARVGLTVTKKLGGAVQRNRIKRRLRAAVRDIFPLEAQPGHDYVILARGKAATRDFPDLLDELRGALLDAREG